MATADIDGPKMISVRRLEDEGQIVLRLSNGVMLAFPETLVPGLTALAPPDRARIEILDGGYVLAWPDGPLYLSYLRLLTDILGTRAGINRLGPRHLRRED